MTSGGGGGGGIPDGGPQDGECQKTYKPINLASSQEDVLKKLERGSQMDLAIEQVGGKPSLRVLYQGEYAGSILKYAAKIIDCINRGHTYVAIVTSLDGGSCVLEVRMTS
jgi:hypothetical protein